MQIGITATACYKPSIFYDVNHNPLNIPCEGPKVVLVTLPMDTDANDTSYMIDFTQLLSQGQISCLQSVSVDMYNQGTYLGELLLTQGGTNQNIAAPVGDLFHSPLCVLNPAQILVSRTSAGNSTRPIQLFFMNYMAPWAA